MNWTRFGLALLAVYVAQTVVVPLLPLGALDLFTVLVLLCGMLAPVQEARLASWITGLAQDIGSVDPLGIHAFCQGLTGWVLTRLRDLFNVDIWWPRGVGAFLAAFVGQFAYHLFRAVWMKDGGLGWLAMFAHAGLTALLASAVMVALTSTPRLSVRRFRRHRARPLTH